MALQSNNPVFARAEGFNGKGGGYAGYGDPSTWSTGSAGVAQQGQADYDLNQTHAGPGEGRMTIDSVVQKTGITLGVVVVMAVLTWLFTPAIESQQVATSLYAISTISALVGFGLAMVNSFKRVVSPPLILLYAAAQGVFMGAISKTFDAAFGDGIVMGAVIGTVAAFIGTLVTYKVLDIKVTDRFRKIVVGGLIGLVGLVLLDFVLGFFNAAIGFNGFGPLGLIISVAILVFAVFSLVLDFDFVERGVAAGLPERESWRAAFGLTATLILIYVQLLRILAILRGD